MSGYLLWDGETPYSCAWCGDHIPERRRNNGDLWCSDACYREDWNQCMPLKEFLGDQEATP